MAEFSFEILVSLNMSFSNTSQLSNSMDPDNAQHFNLNLPRLLTKFNSEIALAGKYLMLFKFNAYPQFAISRQLSN